MANLADHQYAGDARVPFSFGGSGSGRMNIRTDWGTGNLGAGDQQVIYKAAKNCYVSNFAIFSEDMDSHATPTLSFDVGIVATDDLFINGGALTIGEVGGRSVVNNVDESTVAGTVLLADATIIISVDDAATTAVAGYTLVSFDVTLTD
jgi:hypothetical protein